MTRRTQSMSGTQEKAGTSVDRGPLLAVGLKLMVGCRRSRMSPRHNFERCVMLSLPTARISPDCKFYRGGAKTA